MTFCLATFILMMVYALPLSCAMGANVTIACELKITENTEL